MMNRRTGTIAGAACLAAALAFTAGCDNDNDPVAPDNSTLIVSADPSTVIVPQDPPGSEGTSVITATLLGPNGNRLPDQEVTFRTEGSGRLEPPAETPLTTDDQGQATSVLFTQSPTTVTARSGRITGQVNIQTTVGGLATLILQVQPTDTLSSCNDTLTFSTTVRTTSGAPVSGVVVIFQEIDGAGPGIVQGSISGGGQVNSDPNGDASVTWTPLGQSCADQCVFATGDPNNPSRGNCSQRVEVTDITGTLTSSPVTIKDNIP